MSTRCQIAIKDGNGLHSIKIYKHSDGYPNGVLPTLKPFVKNFVAQRGPDIEYCLAQIVRRFAIKEYSDYNGIEPIPAYRYVGWGIDTELHGDIEYLYVVDLSQGGSIEVISGPPLYALIKKQDKKAFRY